MYSIYEIKNISNSKRYIGLTKKTAAKRWIQHKWYAKRKQNSHFYRAIRKYDLSVWSIKILCCCKDIKDAEYMEQYFIKEYDTYVNGYNMTEGGNAFGGLSGQYNGMYGKTHTKEVKEKMGKRAIEQFKNKSYEELYGKENANKLKQQRSKDMKRVRKLKPLDGKNNPNVRKVHIKGIDFDMAADAAIYFGVARSTISGWIRRRKDCWRI